MRILTKSGVYKLLNAIEIYYQLKQDLLYTLDTVAEIMLRILNIVKKFEIK